MSKMPFGAGAFNSPYDSRNAQFTRTLGAPLKKGGIHYEAKDIRHQHNVGICVAISTCQLATRKWNVDFSADFFYLILKTIYEKNWLEGSVPFYSLKAGKNQGFLRTELFCDKNGVPYVTEADRELPYSEYIKKLQAIPQAEIDRLLKLCTHKFSGYAQVDVTDAQLVAKAIDDSEVGILTRYEVGKEWWTNLKGKSSWLTKDIDPLRPPKKVVSGHQIIGSFFDFTEKSMIELANTWGITWNDKNKGVGHADYDIYKMTEAWIPYFDTIPQPNPPFTHQFTRVMVYGEFHPEVKFLQEALKVDGELPVSHKVTDYYGDITKKAVMAFQMKYKVASLAELILVGGKRCGVKTLIKLNDLFDK